MDTLFISDLHLSPERPDKLEQFKQLLRGPARRAKALYILGDIFEQFWVGLDDMTPPNPEIVRELTDFTRSGARLYIQKGNRDLLLDHRFGELIGCTVLPDLAVISVDGVRVMITHGDLLCIRDWKYQIYRKLVMFPLTRAVFSRLPYSSRIKLTHRLRTSMQKSSMNKPDSITDVDQRAVEHLLKSGKVSEIIHGHTHRPGIHEFSLEGHPMKRVVLGDWYGTAEILVCNNRDRQLLPVADYLRKEYDPT
jgi:UDP-2,3-diacylglucosamine hydrolase